jgi:sarcosine oxidase subunit beta
VATLRSKEQQRIVIIGGGIVGACSAYFLARRGHLVTVVEASSIGDGATGLSAGAFRSQFGSPVETMLTMRSRELWQSFEYEYGVEFDYRRVGFVIAASDDRSEAELSRRESFQKELNLDIRDLSMRQLAEIFPNMQTDDIRRATMTPEDGYATPADTTRQIMEVARSKGVKVIQHTDVVDVLVNNDRVDAVVTAPGGPIPCDVVVNAAGLFAENIGEMVGLDIPVGAYRQHQFFTEEITTFSPDSIPNFMDPSLGLYLRGEGHGMLLSVARDDDARRLDFTVDESLLDDLAVKMLHRWPYLADFGVASGWVGCYPITPDSRAIVGDVPHIEGFYNAVGLGGHGFMHGFSTGEAISSLICDGSWGPIDLSEFSLDRFLMRDESDISAPLHI